MIMSAGAEASNRPQEVTGAILAGGASRRMGRDKGTLELGGRPLALWVAQSLRPLVAELWLVTNFPDAHLSLGLPLITDLVPFQGPVGGLATALFYARTPWVLLASADAPFLRGELAAAMLAAAGRLSRPALVCRTAQGLEPFPGLYAVRLLPRVQEYLARERSFAGLLARLRPEVWQPEVWQQYDPPGLSFQNLNHPADLERWAGKITAGGRRKEPPPGQEKEG